MPPSHSSEDFGPNFISRSRTSQCSVPHNTSAPCLILTPQRISLHPDSSRPPLFSSLVTPRRRLSSSSALPSFLRRRPLLLPPPASSPTPSTGVLPSSLHRIHEINSRWIRWVLRERERERFESPTVIAKDEAAAAAAEVVLPRRRIEPPQRWSGKLGNTGARERRR